MNKTIRENLQVLDKIGDYWYFCRNWEKKIGGVPVLGIFWEKMEWKRDHDEDPCASWLRSKITIGKANWIQKP